MSGPSDPLERLVLELARLPGVGHRTASRTALYILKESRRAAERGLRPLAMDLSDALQDMLRNVRLCTRCQNLSREELCGICMDPKRHATQICVVESVADLRAVEICGVFRGHYHVLHGALSPLDGVGPEDLRLPELRERVRYDGCDEVILATNADVEGDSTALYIARMLANEDVKITRLASGIPLGGELEYLDGATLGRALAERRDFES